LGSGKLAPAVPATTVALAVDIVRIHNDFEWMASNSETILPSSDPIFVVPESEKIPNEAAIARGLFCFHTP
jgi:hypothetical protein